MNDVTNKNAEFPSGAKKDRPLWLRVLIWVGIAFLLFNTVGAAALYMLGNSSVQFGRFLVVAVAAATLALPIWRWHGKNVLRTWGNKATADFTRREDPATGGYIFDVRPARAARMPALILFAISLILLLAFMASGSFWIYVIALVFLGVGCSFVLPGARYRHPVTISVSKHGIQNGDIKIPLKEVAELRIDHKGLVVDPDSPMPGPNGVPLASTLGRHMGRRQAERGYVVEIRADGQGQPSVLAGGLTPECARALVGDITKIKDTMLEPTPA